METYNYDPSAQAGSEAKTNQRSITAPDPARSLIQTQLPDSDRPAPSPPLCPEIPAAA